MGSGHESSRVAEQAQGLLAQSATKTPLPFTIALQHHPLLVPWEQLDEVGREKDREVVRNAIQLAAAAGFRLVAL